MTENEPIIKSMLDQDLYKFTMGQAIFFGKMANLAYQNVQVEYQFINRGKTKFPTNMMECLKSQIVALSDVKLTDEEYDWLKTTCPYLKPGYLDFLRTFKYNPAYLKITQDENLKIRICGPWYQTVYFEVPLMAIISELYYKLIEASPQNIVCFAQIKKRKIQANNLIVADFGTRRRFSKKVHETIIAVLHDQLVGTSNMMLAKKYEIKPIGTHAHEWFQALGALVGYRLANHFALAAWADEFGGDLGIALTDTFTTDVFFKQFNMRMSKLFDGVRHDSGNPIEFARKTINHYRSYGIDPMAKTIVFSDNLTVDKAIEIAQWCKNKIKCSFGIGTHLTNDCGFKPLNIVIKMTKCDEYPVVKLSDIPTKHTGTPEAIAHCKSTFNLI